MDAPAGRRCGKCGPAPALSVTLNKLADVLVVEVLRQPERPWTVDGLAGMAAMSRSTFATRFQEVVGTSPLQFIREWRMRRAQMLLREGRSVAAVAALVGYDSEVAFAKAFKRVIGIGPGAVRRH